MNRFMALFFILCITSCVSNETADLKDVNQAEVYQTYRINCVDGQTNLTASFRFGGENGTTLRLTDPGHITANGKKLTEGKFLFGGAFYSRNDASYSAKNTFRFTDVEGKIYENGYEFGPVEFKNSPKTVSESDELIIEVSRKIDAKESVNFRAECDTIKFNETLIGASPQDLVYYDDSAKALVVKPAFFEGFPDIPVAVWMEKSDLKQPLDQPTNMPGELHFSYQSKIITVKRTRKK